MANTVDETHHQEIDSLKQRIAELEQQLEQMAFYQRVFDQLPVAAAIFDLDGLIYQMNRQNEFIFQFPLEAVVGHFNVLTDPHTVSQGFAAYFERARAGEVVTMPPTSVNAAKTDLNTGMVDREVWTEATFFPLYDQQGNLQYIGATYTDMSELVYAMKDLHTFRAMVENAADAIAGVDAQGNITYANASYRRIFQCGDEVIGKNSLNHYQDSPEKIVQYLEQVFTKGQWSGEFTYRRKDGSTFPGLLSAFAITDKEGKGTVAAGIIRDISEQREMEQEQASFQEQIIAAQRTALRELSSPLIPITDHIVIMPLIGTIDSGRAQQVMETLLEGVARYRADMAILDITGVAVMDTQVANVLIQAAQAVQLLGAKVMLTSIGPSMAQTLVHLGADLSGLITRGSLQAGIAAALSHQQQKR